MREFKFRYWDKWNEEMIYSDYDLTKFFERVQELFLGENGVEVMQYTGLKAKNGRDVYEGDLVEYKNFIESGKGVIEFTRGFIVSWYEQKTDKPTLLTPL